MTYGAFVERNDSWCEQARRCPLYYDPDCGSDGTTYSIPLLTSLFNSHYEISFEQIYTPYVSMDTCYTSKLYTR